MADDKKQPAPKTEEKPATAPNNDVMMGIALGMKQMAEMLGLNAQSAEEKPQAPKAQLDGYAQLKAGGRCSACGQWRNACEDKHVKMVVFPTRYPEHAAFFTGCETNGVNYCSNDENHYVVVPEACVADIRRRIAAYENHEKVAQQGRIKNHRSGSLGPGADGVKPYNGGGFV